MRHACSGGSGGPLILWLEGEADQESVAATTLRRSYSSSCRARPVLEGDVEGGRDDEGVHSPVGPLARGGRRPRLAAEGRAVSGESGER